MKNGKWSVLAYVLSFLLIFFSVKVFVSEGSFSRLAQFTPFNIFVILLLTYAIYLTSGIQLSLISKEIGIHLETKDVLFLPLVLNLWSFLIPFQGALIYSTVYLSSKYKSGLKASFSISLFVYLLTIFLTGLFGLVFLVSFNNKRISAYALTLFLLSLPFLLSAFVYFKRFLRFPEKSWLSVLSEKIYAIMETILMLFKKPGLVFKVSLIKVFRTLLIACWYYSITHALGVNLSFLSLILLGLIVDLSIIIKITPDNLGVNQLLSGSIFSFLSLNSNDAVLVTLIASAASIALVFSVGTVANYFFLHSLNFSGIGAVIKQFRNRK